MKNNILLSLAIVSLVGVSLVSCQVENGGGSSTNSGGNQSSTFVIPPDAEVVQGVYANPVSVTLSDGNTNYTKEIADPTVVRGDDGYFYCFSTDQRVLISEDACNWMLWTEKIINRPTWGDNYYYAGSKPNVWAPDVVKVGDKWIYYYSLSGWGEPVGIGYAVADDCGGPYVDQGKLFTGEEMGIENCIDPQVFVDDDGKVYMTVGSFQGLWLLELTADGMGLHEGLETQKRYKQLIAGYDGEWDGATYEGGYITKKGDYYYYFGSAGTCCAGQDSTYRVYVGRSEDIYGPYVGADGFPMTASRSGSSYGELVVHKPMSKNEYAGLGHNSILIDDVGEYWIYYHGYSNQDKFKTRHLFMDKLLWDDNGFPYVENKRPSFEEEIDGPVFLI